MCCSNIKREAQGILCGSKEFHHDCFVFEVRMMTDHMLLVAIFKKDITNLSHRLQRILLQIHQYNIRNQYKPGQLFIQTNKYINKDEEIPRMSININAIETYTDITECMTTEEIVLVIIDEECIGELSK